MKTLTILILLGGLTVSANSQTNTFPASGNAGIGTTNPQAALDIEFTTNAGTGSPVMGLNVYNTVTSGSTGDYPQNHLQSTYNGSATQTFLYGVASSVFESGSGTLTNAYGGLFRVNNNSTSSGAITNGYAVVAASPTISQGTGAGTIRNAYGLYASSQSVQGVTNAFGIYQVGASDVNYFAGKIGINTSTPSQLLEVNGGAQIDGALTIGAGGVVFPNNGGTQMIAYTGVTCGGDYAESVDVSGDRKSYGPGDVLVIDPGHPGAFLKSADAYSTSVTGIYSTKPGTVGRRQTGPANPDEVPMAMIGIVPTKVSAENGPIRPGDLLVTSQTPGYAMKGTDRSQMLGAVIGKALGNLESGTGVVEVMVTLQ